MPDLQPSDEAVEALAEEIGRLNAAQADPHVVSIDALEYCERLVAAALPVIYADLRERMGATSTIKAAEDAARKRFERGGCSCSSCAASAAGWGVRAALDTAMKGGGGD